MKKPFMGKLGDMLAGFYAIIPGQVLNPILDLLKKPVEPGEESKPNKLHKPKPKASTK